MVNTYIRCLTSQLHVINYKRRVIWLPCEIEALSIAAEIRHFIPYIVQSNHKASVLTDNKPRVKAYEKLCRGEFSVSPRVSTFLSVVTDTKHQSDICLVQLTFHPISQVATHPRAMISAVKSARSPNGCKTPSSSV